MNSWLRKFWFEILLILVCSAAITILADFAISIISDRDLPASLGPLQGRNARM